MKLKSLINAFNDLAPQKLALSWDNVGLQIGDPKKEISKIMICLTIDSNIVKQAIDKNIDLIVSHHPLIFNSLKKIRADKPVQRQVFDLIKNDISLFVMHTNLDVVSPGVNSCLFSELGGNIESAKILSVTSQEKLFKLCCYVPTENAEAILNAMFSKGAGSIGDYDECSFSIKGTGTFRGGEHTNPYIGTPGKREYVNEQQIETIVAEKDLEKVKSIMISAHPYEEVAYDIFELVQKGRKYGLGLYGKVIGDLTIERLLKQTKGQLKGFKLDKKIKKLAVCGGSGADLIEKAYKAGCDCYVTGDIKYHDEVLAEELGLCLIDMGHYNSELPVLYMIENYIQKLYDNSVEILVME